MTRPSASLSMSPSDPARAARLLALYRTMLEIRAFEDAAEAASRGGVSAFGQQVASGGAQAEVRGPLHLSTGQEAVAVGVCANLRREDKLTSTHRGHGHTLAKGADPARMMQELYGRASGLCHGHGGSMHIADFSVGMLGANGVVAAGIPIAVGAAHSLKIQRRDAVACCFFGDGAVNRGPFLEGLNWAAAYALPVLFVCEDNHWSATTRTGSLTAGAGAAERARACAVPAQAVDGNDVEAVDEAAKRLLGEIRSGGGPRLLHAITYRFKGHVSVDPAAYRDPEELARAMRSDPLALARERLRALGISERELDAAAEVASARIAAAVASARSAPVPQAAAAFADVQDTGDGAWW